MGSINTGLCLAMGVWFIACGGSDAEPPIGSALRTCEPFTACGGDLNGTWTVDSMCVAPRNTDYPPGLPALCMPGFRDYALSATFTNVNLAFDFVGSRYTVTGSGTTSGRWVLPDDCVKGLTGNAGASDASCAFVESRLNGSSTVLCQFVAASCECSITSQVGVPGGIITVSGANMQWNGSSVSEPYCVQGTTASFEYNGLMGPLDAVTRFDLHR